jgi:hypothetical protein
MGRPAALTLACAAALTVLVGAAAATASAAPAAHRFLRPGGSLRAGQALTSPNGQYTVGIHRDRLAVRRSDDSWLWASPKAGPDPILRLTPTGQLKLTAGRHTRWAAGTAGSGSHDVLSVRNDGELALTAPGGAVWTSRLRNTCPRTHGPTFVVDLSAQAARACAGGRQLRVTRVTTGATALGEGTPRGSWHVQAKVRNTTLYPAGGGAYPVQYWVPYDGAYGLHDAPWQHFRYGSPKYHRHGSHGCVHVPGRMMAWVFHWVRVGRTAVVIHA